VDIGNRRQASLVTKGAASAGGMASEDAATKQTKCGRIAEVFSHAIEPIEIARGLSRKSIEQ
jgi:hypothetical protein